MTFPSNWRTVTVSGTILKLDGQPPVGGYILFECLNSIGYDNTTVIPSPLKVAIGNDGYFAAVLPVAQSDDEFDVTYKVTESVEGGRKFYARIPADRPIVPYGDLDMVAPTNDMTALRGPRGLSNYELAVRNGFIGTEVDYLNSLKPQMQVLDAAPSMGGILYGMVIVLNDPDRGIYYRSSINDPWVLVGQPHCRCSLHE